MKNKQIQKIRGSAMIEYGLIAAAATIIFTFLPAITWYTGHLLFWETPLTIFAYNISGPDNFGQPGAMPPLTYSGEASQFGNSTYPGFIVHY